MHYTDILYLYKTRHLFQPNPLMTLPNKLIFLLSSTIVLSFACPHSSCSSLVDKTTITHLPGYNGPLPFRMETGYVIVDEKEEQNMFYYFIESQKDPPNDPVVVWLTGGRGCSGLSTLLFMIGPITIDYKNYDGGLPTLISTDYPWTKVLNVIFIDSSLGAGFTYANNHTSPEGDFEWARKVHNFIKKWFDEHPKFLSNPFYLGAESYSGFTMPIVAKRIADDNDAKRGTFINLQGYMAGNPSTDYEAEQNWKIPYAHGMGLISDELYESLKENCGGNYQTPENAICASYVAEANRLTSRINPTFILEPFCDSLEPMLQENIESGADRYVRNLLSLKTTRSNCRAYGYLLAFYWANDNAVREALGVRKGTVDTWRKCSNGLIYNQEINNSVMYHDNLTRRGYRALIFSGDHDLVVPFLGTQAWIRSLNFPIIRDWSPWWVDDQIAGYTRTYSNNLTFVTVKGGGHTAPEYRPEECLEMVRRWLYAESL